MSWKKHEPDNFRLYKKEKAPKDKKPRAEAILAQKRNAAELKALARKLGCDVDDLL